MANTITYADGTVQVLFDGATAWAPGQVYRVVSFEFFPSANSDAIKVRDGSATGAIVFLQVVDSAAGVSDQRKGYEFGYKGKGKNITPYVVGNEASSGSILIMKYA